jgi:hypothetical protein
MARGPRRVPKAEVAASFDQASSTRDVGGIAGGECSRLSSENLAGAFGRAAERANFTPCWNAGNHLFRSQLRNSIWDRSVKLSGLYRSGARHASATDLTQYLLANLIVRVENTGFCLSRATRIQA